MSGLVKAKDYDWKDSNLALFGSDVEKNVKKESAETEVAWKGAGRRVGLQIWRIVKFKVVDWPKENYGKFYNGDSYIILNTYKNQDEILYDVHFWIGRHSTQDEYGTAAYKTVELDTLLDDKPVQHREVEGHESDIFKSYFQRIELLEGGADSGFRKVTPEEYKPRLLHVTGKKDQCRIQEVLFHSKSLNQKDVFIIDCGLKIYQWNGEDSHLMERYTAGKYITDLRSARGGKPALDVLDNQLQEDLSEELLDIFEKYGRTEQQAKSDSAEGNDETDKENTLIRVSDASGSIELKVIAKGKAVVNRKMLLKSDDVFILDTVKECFVWIGKKASAAEKRNALTYAHIYLNTTRHPLVAISCFKEGSESPGFINAFK